MSKPDRKYPPFILKFGNKYRFEFTIEQPALTRAICYGRTETEFEKGFAEQIQNFFPGESGKRRFPNATPFDTVEAAQNECDRWRLVLQDRYFVPVRSFSGGFVTTWPDESKDSLELKDFLARNATALELHRAANKPDTSLDYLAEYGSPEQKDWVLSLQSKQAYLNGLLQSHNIPEVKKKLKSVQRYLQLLESPLTALTEATNDGHIKNSCDMIRAHGLTIETQCERLISIYEQAQRELETLKANRP